MKTFSHPLLDARYGRRSATSHIDSMLRAIGAESAFTDDVIGDLVEEHDRRAAIDGVRAARWWYVREAARSVPHLVRNAAVRGGPRARVRLAGIAALLVAIPALALAALTFLPGPPVRLAAAGRGTSTEADGVVINTRQPVRLAVHAFDARGHRLSGAAARYQWTGGDQLAVSPTGVAACRGDGDAFVRATLGSARTTVRVLCRPVAFVFGETALALLVGDSAHALRWRAYGPDGRRVDELSATLRVADSTVATLRGNVVRPVAPGRTQISMDVGDAEAMTEVDVYERVGSFRGLRRNQLYVAAPVLLPLNGALHWPLPKGEFWLRYRQPTPDDSMPKFTVDGRVTCMDEPSGSRSMMIVHCAARDAHGSILVRNLDSPLPIGGTLFLERRADYLAPAALP